MILRPRKGLKPSLQKSQEQSENISRVVNEPVNVDYHAQASSSIHHVQSGEMSHSTNKTGPRVGSLIPETSRMLADNQNRFHDPLTQTPSQSTTMSIQNQQPLIKLKDDVSMVRLSQLNMIQVCGLISIISDISEEHCQLYQKRIQDHNVTGFVLSVCDLDQLRNEIGMTFGDWQLFNSLILHLRTIENQQSSENIISSMSQMGNTQVHENSWLLGSQASFLNTPHKQVYQNVIGKDSNDTFSNTDDVDTNWKQRDTLVRQGKVKPEQHQPMMHQNYDPAQYSSRKAKKHNKRSRKKSKYNKAVRSLSQSRERIHLIKAGMMMAPVDGSLKTRTPHPCYIPVIYPTGSIHDVNNLEDDLEKQLADSNDGFDSQDNLYIEDSPDNENQYIMSPSKICAHTNNEGEISMLPQEYEIDMSSVNSKRSINKRMHKISKTHRHTHKEDSDVSTQDMKKEELMSHLQAWASHPSAHHERYIHGTQQGHVPDNHYQHGRINHRSKERNHGSKSDMLTAHYLASHYGAGEKYPTCEVECTCDHWATLDKYGMKMVASEPASRSHSRQLSSPSTSTESDDSDSNFSPEDFNKQSQSTEDFTDILGNIYMDGRRVTRLVKKRSSAGEPVYVAQNKSKNQDQDNQPIMYGFKNCEV